MINKILAILTLVVYIGMSHDGAVWEHVDEHMRAPAVQAH